MRTATTHIRWEPLEPGVYRVTVAEWYILETPFGTSVVMRFERPKKKGWLRPSIKVWVDADLTGGERPSRLYSWISALAFDGGPLPEGYSLETASLLLRKARAVIDVVERDGVRCNRIVRLLPLLNSATLQFPAVDGAAVSLGGDEWEADLVEDNL
jgi:hypothetical protein